MMRWQLVDCAPESILILEAYKILTYSFFIQLVNKKIQKYLQEK